MSFRIVDGKIGLKGTSGHNVDVDAAGMLHIVLHDGTTVSGHANLLGLDYESSGHIGFASAEELTTTSGSLQDIIDANTALIATTSGSIQTQLDSLDTVYATDVQLTAVSGSLQTQIDSNDTAIEDNITLIGTTSGTLQDEIDTKSDIGHTHDDIYFTEAEITSLLAVKEDIFTTVDGGSY